MDLPALDRLLQKESGLKGLSGGTSDMQALLSARANDAASAEAVEVFCRRAAQFTAAMATSLGGLDTLVFTGGIGEHAAPVRAEISGHLAWLGVQVDAARNAAHAAVISPDQALVTVRVIPTDEERQVALHVSRLMHEDRHDGPRRPA